MRPYVIRQGDHVERIARRFGFDADAIWNHADNAELRRRRGSPHVLAPGDVLFIPSPALRRAGDIRARATHRFRGARATVPVKVVVHLLGEPLRHERCELMISDPPEEATTDGEAVLSVDVPHDREEVVVHFPERGFRMRLRVGHLDPIDTEAGITARLENLGYLLPHELVATGHSDLNTPGIRQRIRRRGSGAFQRSQDIEPTGELDQATREALEREHGA